LALDKSKSLGGIEPLHCSMFLHVGLSLSKLIYPALRSQLIWTGTSTPNRKSCKGIPAARVRKSKDEEGSDKAPEVYHIAYMQSRILGAKPTFS
jgi:hypothetical protein